MRGILWVILLLFSGCSLKEKLLKEDILYKKYLENTQSFSLITSFETKAIIKVSWFDKIEDVNKTTQDFLVAIFSELNKVKKGDFNITLNSNPPLKIRLINSDNKLLKKLNLNKWFSYFLVQFKKDDNLVKVVKIKYEKNEIKFIFNE